MSWAGWMPQPDRKCVGSRRGGHGWGIFFLQLGLQGVREISSPSFCFPAEMSKPTAEAAWPGLVLPEAGRAARSRIRGWFVSNGSSRNLRRGYSSCFLFPHPNRCQGAVVGQCLLHPIHRAGNQGSELQKLLFPPPKLLVRQGNDSNALGDPEKGPICLAF